MTLTTLCYLIKDNKYLMLHRTKKEHDINAGKYIGVGGHVEEGESPTDCIKREVFEETGLILNSVKMRGYITFVMGDETEHAILFTSDDFNGTLAESCSEGELTWVDIDKVMDLNLWEGDRAFLKLLKNQDQEGKCEFFSLKLVYDGEDNLLDTIFEGQYEN
ncbi:NUDIX hydrolase [Pseudobutyrivibrio ruminis]|uniref:NUDIX hydrolase n=1 Tax=Pseudobutyrivibrio ruminis TaxID=46206 RepID=UPI00051C62CA|nr:8-oxo-dGTP diphosphatase [Pseudobutyrivibrio ruminis]